MSETKKKSSWFMGVVISLAFVALIAFLLFSFLSDGKDQATSLVDQRLLNYATIWEEELSAEIDRADECGGILADELANGNVDYFNDEAVDLLASIVANTSFYRVFLCDLDENAIDDLGNTHDMAQYSLYFTGSEDSVKRYLYMNSDGMDNSKVIVVSYPLKTGYALFFLDLDAAAEKLSETGYENVSFGVLFKKDGTILRTLPGLSDTDSKFVTASNFLSAVQEGASREKYNIFKARLYNVTGCALESTFNGDERTIVAMPLGIEDWYLAIGIRQYQVDTLVDSEFKSAKSTVVKLMIVFVLFAIYFIVTVAINASKSRERGKVLEDKADMDLLTELTNKAATERLIAEYMQQNPNGRGVLFILDIDNFKKVNDTMGHAFGDTLLKTLGKEIKTEFRVTDIVGRTGGDEFMIFLKDIKDDLIVEREAHRVTHFFHDFKAGGDYVKYSATASIGAAVFPEDGAEFKDLYVSADQALYRAKKRGKNQLVFFNEEKFGK